MSSAANECSKARVARPRVGLSNPCEAFDQQKGEASLKVVALMLPLVVEKISAPFSTLGHAEGNSPMPANSCSGRTYWWT
jgi:hypothetical protein